MPISAAPFVPGDLIVKFMDGSESDVAVARAGEPGPGGLRSLMPLVHRLQDKAEVPLKPKQLLSGRRILVSIDADKLTEQLVEQLRGRDHVAATEVSRQRLNEERTPLPNKILIEFVPGSPESESVRQKLTDADAAGFATLLSDLERDLHLPLKGEVAAQAKLLLQVDFTKLTLAVVDRLKTVAEIESAQPNFLMRIR
jgi:hypothetical protein